MDLGVVAAGFAVEAVADEADAFDEAEELLPVTLPPL